jgi:hypothetical protein
MTGRYLEIDRTDAIIIIQITLATGRTTEMEKALYPRIAELPAAEFDVRPGDVFVILLETRRRTSPGRGASAVHRPASATSSETSTVTELEQGLDVTVNVHIWRTSCRPCLIARVN